MHMWHVNACVCDGFKHAPRSSTMPLDHQPSLFNTSCFLFNVYLYGSKSCCLLEHDVIDVAELLAKFTALYDITVLQCLKQFTKDAFYDAVFPNHFFFATVK